MQVSRPLLQKRATGRFFCGEFGPRQYIHVYAICPRGGGNIKFGQALNVKRRFSGIQTGSPVPLVVLGSVYVPTDTEPHIHDHLRADRSHGEWFLPTKEVLAVADLIVNDQKADLLRRIGLSRLLPDDRLMVNGPPKMLTAERFRELEAEQEF